MKRRGITLLELLLAIGLMLALAGLVLPAVFSGLNERAFASSAEVVQSQLLLARAHAQMTGRPVEVTYDDRPPSVGARLFELTLEPDESPEITANWAHRALVDGIRITDQPPEGESETPDDQQAIRLAVYLPDGSALMGRAVWVHDEHGRRGRLWVNPWTGLPGFERGAAELPEQEEEPEEEEESELDPEPDLEPDEPQDEPT